MALKIPSDIEEVIKSTAGHEPVAFIDVWEERGDFDVIDTQNQFIALNDPAVASDVDVDFERKPGFAVLAAGKRVFAKLITDLGFFWDFRVPDWTAVFGGIPSINQTLPLLTFKSSLGNYIFVPFIETTAYLRTFAILKSTDQGQNFSVVDKIDTLAGITQSNALGETVAYDRISNFDHPLIMSYRDDWGPSVEFVGSSEFASSFSIVDNASASYNYLRFASGVIGGQYFVGYKGGGISSNEALLKIASDNAFSSVQEYSFGAGTGPSGYAYISSINKNGNDIFVCVVDPQSGGRDVFQIYKGQASIIGAYSFTLINTVVAPANTAIEPMTKMRFVNGSIVMFSDNWNKAFQPTNVLVSTDLGVSFSMHPTPISYARVQTAGYDNGSLVCSSKAAGEFIKTVDGINWTTEHSGIVNSANSGEPTPFYDETADISVLAAYNKTYASSFAPPVTNAGDFKYDIFVEDNYMIDPGRGKK